MVGAIFFDRDGTICEDLSVEEKERKILSKNDFKWLPMAKNALELLVSIKIPLFIITNQSAINRGLLSVESFEEINELIYSEIEKLGGKIIKTFYCPHLEYENCVCRKPSTFLIKRAEKEFEINLKESYVIGDQTSDIKMGEDVGSKTILVLTGFGGSDEKYRIDPKIKSKDLYEASLVIKNLEK